MYGIFWVVSVWYLPATNVWYPTHNNNKNTVHAQLYEAGMKHITNVDIHAPTIAEMTSRHHGVKQKHKKKNAKKRTYYKKYPLAY